MTTRPTRRLATASRHCRLMIAVWALMLTPCLAVAQSIDGQNRAGHFIPPAPAAANVFSAANGANGVPVAVPNGSEPQYWIVSTRHARHEVENGQACNYEVFRFNAANQGRGSSLDELLSSLQPGVPVCFMAHGSFVIWESVLNDSAQTHQWLRQAAPGQPLHIIFYTWASDDNVCLPHLRVNLLGSRASMNGFYLADLVSKVSTDHPISLIGHSHGTRMVSAALHSMAGGAIEGRMLAGGAQPPRRIRAVLAAAAIDHDWLNPNEQYGMALSQTECVINLRNRMDLPLLFYPLRRPISPPALAITGLTRRDRAKLGDWNQKIVDYDVTRTIGLGHIWENYYSQPSVATAIRHFVYFDEPGAARESRLDRVERR